jgi:hypothetical protein
LAARLYVKLEVDMSATKKRTRMFSGKVNPPMECTNHDAENCLGIMPQMTAEY